MSKPRVLFVPIAAAIEVNHIAPSYEWAEFVSFDAPGAGANRALAPRGVAGVVEAAVRQLDELDWTSCCVMAESHGQAAAIELAVSHPDRVAAICLGHAAAHYRVSGDRTAMVPAIHDAAAQLLETDYRSFARAITQMTQGLLDDDYVEAWVEAVPQPVAYDLLSELTRTEPDLVERLSGSDLPLVLGKHNGCVMWTPESFEEACQAAPRATTVVCDEIPTKDPAFVEAVREVALRVATS